MQWVRDRSLGIFFVGMFLTAWIAQLGVEWLQFKQEQGEHGAVPIFWSGDFWVTFGQSTLENWQSEFLQLGAFVIAAAYFVYKGSAESPDADERIEAKLDALLRERGVEPTEIETALPGKYHRRADERAQHDKASRRAVRSNGRSSGRRRTRTS